VIWTRDTKRPTREIIEVLRKLAPHWQYHELSEGGHMFPLSQPEITNRLISTFLREVRTGRETLPSEAFNQH